MKRCIAVELVSDQVKDGHSMGHNHFRGRDNDRANDILAGAGYNCSLLLRWFEALLRTPIGTILRATRTPQTA